jgi:hypothetical protein
MSAPERLSHRLFVEGILVRLAAIVMLLLGLALAGVIVWAVVHAFAISR